jgi:hypothetical protein
MAYGIDRLPDEQHRHDRRLAGVGRDFDEPDRGLDRLDLAEGLEFLELMMTPVLEQPCGLRRNLPLVKVRQPAPGRDMAANFIDDLGRRC